MRIRVLLTFLCVLVVSCQKGPNPGKISRDITFRVTTENATKSTALTTESLKSKDFELYALYAGGNNPYTVENLCFLNGYRDLFFKLFDEEDLHGDVLELIEMIKDYYFGPETISYTNNKWQFTSTPYKWPEVSEDDPKNLSFFAAAPSGSQLCHAFPLIYFDDATNMNDEILDNDLDDTYGDDTPGTTIVSGIIVDSGHNDNDAVEQDDLLIAFTPNRTKEQGEVPLLFRHALSAVNICVGDILEGLTPIKVGASHVRKTSLFTIGLLDEQVCVSTVLDEELIDDYYQKNPTYAKDLKTQTDKNTFWLCPQKREARIELEYQYEGNVTTAGRTIKINWEPGKVYSYKVNVRKAYDGEIIIDCDNVTIEDIIEEDIYDLNY